MEKENVTTRTPPRKAPKGNGAPVRTLPMDEVKRLIRKTTRQHAELFRRLAQ
jgi:hypothetical protein